MNNSFILISEVTSVAKDSPASQAGLRQGDFLVKCADELVIFMSHQEIESKLKQMSELQLDIEIERGQLEPMRGPEIDHVTMKKNQESSEDKFTIVLDRERGIYQYPSK